MVAQTLTYNVMPAEASDLKVLLGMWSDLTRYLYPSDAQPFGELTPQRFQMLKTLLDNTFENTQAAIFKAVDSAGNLMGTIAVVLNQQLGFSCPDSGIIFNLWVLPEQRHGGVGQALVSEAKTWLADNGAKSVQVGWNPQNRSADHFWTKQGFKAFEILASSSL